MNKRGLAFFYTFMLGIIVVVLGISFATPITQVIGNSMSSTELTCATPATDYDQAACWFLDILKPLLIGFFIILGLAIMTAKGWII